MANRKHLRQQPADHILCDRRWNHSPQHLCWKPECPYSLQIPNRSQYVKLENIERIVHFEDFKDMFHASSIIPNQIRGTSHSSMPQGMFCSWFGIPTQGEHSWYGNVSCKVNFAEFLRIFKPRCHFVEIVEFRTTTRTRLLFTTRRLPFLNNVSKYDALKPGGPWYRDGNGNDYYLSDCRRFDKGNNVFKNEPEFVIVLKHHEYETLYQMCSVSPANHSSANYDIPQACRKYDPELCPTPWDVRRCKAELNEFYAAHTCN